MYRCEVMGNYGFVLTKKDFEKKKVWFNGEFNAPYIQCTTDKGIICLVPVELWEEVQEVSNEEET